MEHHAEIARIEVKARSVGLSLTAACLAAGIYPHYVSRWKRPGVSPNLATWTDFTRRMHAVLDARAAEQRIAS